MEGLAQLPIAGFPMQTTQLPSTAAEMLDWSWGDFQPWYDDLLSMDVSAETVDAFLREWSRVSDLVDELENRLYVAKTVDTADSEAEARFNRYLDGVYPKAQEAEQQLKQKLLQSGLEPPGFEIPLRKMRTQAELFREQNVPLLAEEQKLGMEYDEIIGSQTITWKGVELPLPRVLPIYQDTDRSVREDAWRLSNSRQLQDRGRINDLWQRFLDLRLRLAENAGLADYREYRWRQLLRFDYSPEDNKRFHEAVKEVVVPAAVRIHERRQRDLEVSSLRPWDLYVDRKGRPALRPFAETAELEQGVSGMFHRLDPQLGQYFDLMVEDSLLDLDSRKNKAPGGYCTAFRAVQSPFIFMNAAGTHSDVQTLLHESGHAFHVFETRHLPYAQQKSVGHEFAEVASMSMELLAAPNLREDRGGFYSPADAARARIEHLESIILLWVRLMYVDAFQHWVYENPNSAADPDDCDRQWTTIYAEYMPVLDWDGLEDELQTGWHKVLHIHEVPFYIIEYAMAQMAAVQLWAQARKDPSEAVDRYRKGLSLGGTRSLPELFGAVGAEFDFSTRTLGPAVQLIEEAIEELQMEAA